MRAANTKTRSDKGKHHANYTMPPPKRVRKQRVDTPKGPGPFWSAENRIERLCELWKTGMTTALMAVELGTTKNAIIGMRARLGLKERAPIGPEPTTLFQRMDAIHANVDRVIAETWGVGRVPDSQRAVRH